MSIVAKKSYVLASIFYPRCTKQAASQLLNISCCVLGYASTDCLVGTIEPIKQYTISSPDSTDNNKSGRSVLHCSMKKMTAHSFIMAQISLSKINWEWQLSNLRFLELIGKSLPFGCLRTNRETFDGIANYIRQLLLWIIMDNYKWLWITINFISSSFCQSIFRYLVAYTNILIHSDKLSNIWCTTDNLLKFICTLQWECAQYRRILKSIPQTLNKMLCHTTKGEIIKNVNVFCISI